MFENFKRGSGGRYIWDEKQKKLVKVSESAATPDAGFNGPVWFPKGGYKYFDKALQRTFHSKQEKKDYMRAHGLKSAGSDDKKCSGPEAGLGRTLYSVPGLKKANSKAYKYR